MTTYKATRCQCGHPACIRWQVLGIAPEAKFQEREANAVARLLTIMDANPTRKVVIEVGEELE